MRLDISFTQRTSFIFAKVFSESPKNALPSYRASKKGLFQGLLSILSALGDNPRFSLVFASCNWLEYSAVAYIVAGSTSWYPLGILPTGTLKCEALAGISWKTALSRTRIRCKYSTQLRKCHRCSPVWGPPSDMFAW